MMRRDHAYLWLALAPLAVAHAQSASQDFSILNRTGFQIESIRLSEAGTNRWGNNVLGMQTLFADGKVQIAFAPSEPSCSWDVMVQYRDHSTAIWPGIDVCSLRRVALLWDRAPGQTIARAE